MQAVAAASAAAAGPALAGCRAAPASSGNPGGGNKKSSGGGAGKVVYWDWYVSQSPWVKNEVNLFQAANPKIQVNRTVNATGAYDKLFNLAQRSHNAPDVFMITTTTVPLNDQVQKGWLLPVNQYADSAWVHQFPEYTFAEGSNVFNGKIYTAPISSTSAWVQLYINTKVFKDAGLTNGDGSVKIPKTWDDITHAAEQITKKSNGSVYGLGFGNSSFDILPWWVEIMVRGAGSPGGNGGQDLRTGKYTFGSDRNYKDVLDLIMEWKSKGYFYPSSLSISDEIARAYFERGKFGMTVGGVWNQPEWTDHKFTDYTLTSLIGPQEKPKSYFYSQPGGTLFAINANAKDPEAAFKWFSWLYSPEAGKRWVQKFNEDLSIFPADDDPSKISFKPFGEYVALRDLVLPGPQPWIKNPHTSQVVVNPVTPNFGNITTGIYSGQIKDTGKALTDLDGKMQQALETGIKQAQGKGLKVSLSDYAFSDWDPTKAYKWPIPKYPSL